MAHPASGRKKTDHINFGKAVEGIPNGSYASRVVHEITRRRQALEDVLKYPDTSTSTVMNTLHGYLVLPMRHVLNEARRPYKLKFKWTSFIHPDEEMFVSKDSDVDHVAFLVAVSLWLMEHAQMAFPLYPKEDSLNEEKMKDALNSLKLAAGLCECVEQRPKSDYLDLTVPVNQALRLQCLAQAQMVTINRAVWKGNKASLISQLAHDVAKQCLAASSILQKCGKQVEKWRLFLVFKGELYFAIARCFQGIDFLEVQQKSGLSVAVLTTASRHISACYQLSKEYTKLKPKERHPLPACRDFIWAQNFITLKLEKSERENSMVYNQRIPDEPPPLNDPRCLVSPTPFHFPDEDSLFLKEDKTDASSCVGKIDEEEGKRPDNESKMEDDDETRSGCACQRLLFITIFMPVILLLSLIGCIGWLLLWPVSKLCPAGDVFPVLLNSTENVMKLPVTSLNWALGKKTSSQTSSYERTYEAKDSKKSYGATDSLYMQDFDQTKE